jgi:hypothetical protein
MAWSINEPDITSADHPKVNSTAAAARTDPGTSKHLLKPLTRNVLPSVTQENITINH